MDMNSEMKKSLGNQMLQMQSGDIDTSASENEIIDTKTEPDPELIWKQNRKRWQQELLWNSPGPHEPEPPPPGAGKSLFFKMFMIRLVISVLLFAVFWGIKHYPVSWTLPVREFVAQSLTEEMDFAAVQSWYDEHFGGSPSFIPIFGQSKAPSQKVHTNHIFVPPLAGSLAESYALSLKGVEIMPKSPGTKSEVKSIETGRVTEVSQDALTGKTVTIQHSDGYVSVYGRLTEVSIRQGDWLEGGEVIGILSPSTEQGSDTLYFAVRKDGRYIDPADVVPFD